ncbi:MAG: hypothetical protein R3C09_22360 [Pirellulaceae bacterium]
MSCKSGCPNTSNGHTALAHYAGKLRVAKLLSSSPDGSNTLAAAMPFAQEDVVKYLVGATFELLEFARWPFSTYFSH